MATSPRDVKLGLSVETTGDEKIKELQKAVAALAKEGGDAAPEFQALADEIGRLGEQQQTITKIRALNDAFDDLVAKQEAATAAVADNAAKLTAAGRAADNARAAQERAAAVQAQAKAALAETSSALTILRNSYDENGNRVDGYKAKLQQLIVTKEAEKRAVREAGEAHDAAKAATAAAAKTADDLQKSYTRSAAEATKLSAAVREQSQVLESAAAAAEALGVSSTNLAAAQAQVSTRLADTQREAVALSGQLDNLAAAEREVAAATALAAQRAEEQAEALRAADAARAAAEAKALADAERLLAAEFQFAAETARRLAAAQDDAAAAAARLRQEQSDDFTRKLAIAQGLLTTELELAAAAADRAGAEQRRLDAAQEETAESARRAAAAAAEAGQRIEAAFGTVGVRSAEALQAEIVEVRSAMDLLSTRSRETGQAVTGAFAAGEARIKSLQREMRELNGQLTIGDRAAKLFNNSLGQIAAGNLIADAVGSMVEKVKDLGRAFVSTIAQNEQFRRGLNAIYKDSALAERQMEFLRQTALATGVSMGDIQAAFVKFSAATKSANIPLSQTNELFAAVTGAAASLGLNGEAVSGMLEALGQMASKGTVSLEELRQQLGDRLPGALSLVAQGLNLTEGELIKLVESGTLAARDLFPALTKALGSMQGEVTGLVPAYEQLKTALQDAAKSAGDAGWATLMAGALRALAGVLAVVVIPLHALSEAAFLVGRAVLALYGVLTGDKGAWKFFQDSASEAARRVAKTTEAFGVATGAIDANTKSMGSNAVVSTSVTASMGSLNLATATTSEGMKAQALVGERLKASNGELSASYVRISADLQKAAAALDASAEVRAKEAKAIADEGAAMVNMARLRGDERALLDAQVVATNNNVTALENVATARRAESEVLATRLALAQQMAAASEAEAKARAAEIDKITEKLNASRAETEQATASAAAARAVALGQQIAAEAYRDNSQSIAAWQRVMIAAQADVDRLTIAVRDGWATTEQLRAAQQRLTTSTALYRDGLADTTERLKQSAAAAQAKLAVDMASLGVQSQVYNSLAASARASGNLTQATYYEIEAKRIQIQITQLTAKAKMLEANSTIAQVEAERKELEAKGPLTQAKKDELEARLLNAKAKQIEAGASVEIIRALEAEITAIRNNVNARGSSVSTTQADTSARYANRDAINAQTAALEKQQVTSDGFKANKDGSAAGSFSNSLPVQDAYAIIEKMQRGDLGAGDLEQARTGYQQARNSQQWLQSLNPGSVSTEARTSTDALVRGAEQALRKAEAFARRDARGGQNTTGQFGSSAASNTTTVQISLGGRTTPVGVNSPQDAQALTGVLRQLESAAGTAQ